MNEIADRIRAEIEECGAVRRQIEALLTPLRPWQRKTLIEGLHNSLLQSRSTGVKVG